MRKRAIAIFTHYPVIDIKIKPGKGQHKHSHTHIHILTYTLTHFYRFTEGSFLLWKVLCSGHCPPEPVPGNN